MRERLARITSIREIAPAVLEIDASAVEPARIGFRPGQFVSIRLPDGAGDRRSYSVASRHDRNDGFRLLVRDAGGLGATFVGSLSPGDELQYFGPMGYFLLDEHHPADVVFGATGVGVSALFPMMEEAISRREPGQVRFFWGLETEDDLFWQHRLDALDQSERFSYQIYYAARGQGFITPHVVATAQALSDPTYYLCGNGIMVRDAIAGLVSSGVDRKRQVRTEAFTPVVA